MSSSAEGAPVQWAGFWRRLGAVTVDVLVVSVAIQLIVAMLFAATNGAVQSSSGFVIRMCADSGDMTQVRDFQPPPPADSNFWMYCHISFLGLETARTLTIGNRVINRSPGVVISRALSNTYALGKDNTQVDPIRVTDIWTITILLLYLIVMEKQFGATLGKRWLRLRVVNAAGSDQPRIGLGQATIRNIVVLSGLAPLILVLMMSGLNQFQAFIAPNLTTWLMAAGGLGVIWYAWMALDIRACRDPLYDRLARTSVRRRLVAIPPP
jgi:uncharacterized RDD family membrane protein YckC